jgi:hypothetical protein
MDGSSVITEVRLLPSRGDAFARWLKEQRDNQNRNVELGRQRWAAIDGLLDTYRLHADTGTPLDQEACEGG